LVHLIVYYCSGVIKKKEMCGACFKNVFCILNLCLEEIRGRAVLGSLGMEGRVILELMLKERLVGMVTGSVGSGCC